MDIAKINPDIREQILHEENKKAEDRADKISKISKESITEFLKTYPKCNLKPENLEGLIMLFFLRFVLSELSERKE